MNIAKWKITLPEIITQLCQETVVGDVCIDWVDIIFEQSGNASKCPPHTHTWFEFNYVFAGEMITRFGDAEATIQAGEFFLIPPGMLHSHSYNRASPHEGICLRWRQRPSSGEVPTEANNDSFYAQLELLRAWKPGGYSDRYGIQELLIAFLEEAASHQRSMFSLRLMLTRLLEALTVIDQPDKLERTLADGSKDSLIKKIEVYLEDFQGERLSVAELASSMHLSYGHLSRLYKDRTGMTLVERMNQIRLDKASVLLQQPALLIKDVAENAGFPDIYYFSKTFKRRYGVSPQAYRKQLQESSR